MTHDLLIDYFIAAVWLVNGLLCKLLNFVPRHQQIVARITGSRNAAGLTRTIGVLEIAMAGWIVSGIAPKWNVVVQVVIIATMNALEFVLARDLLLWGRLNALFAFLFILLICFHR